MKAKWQLSVLIAAVAVAGDSTGAAAGVTATGRATLHFHGGRQTLSVRLHEPAGEIQLYRMSAARGARVRASVQLPGITVPLRIATEPVGPSSSCVTVGV